MAALALTLLLTACPAESPEPADEQNAPPNAVLSPSQFVAIVDQPLALSVGASSGDKFVWTFGDGEELTGSDVDYTPRITGRIPIQLAVANDDGQTDIASGTLVAVNAPLETAPTTSSKLSIMDGTLYAVLPDSDELVLVRENAVASRWPTCQKPAAVSAAHGFVAVACEADAVWVYDPGGSVVSTYEFSHGSRPMGVAISPSADAATVALAGSDEVLSWNWTEGALQSAEVADPYGVAVTSEATFSARYRSSDEAGQAWRIDESGVATAFAIPKDLGPDSDTDARGLPTLLGVVALSPDGQTLVVAGAKANTDRGLRRDGLAYTFETATRSTLRVLDATTGEQLSRSLFDNRDVVGSVAFTPMGDLLLVAHQGAGEVDILDPFTLSRVGGFQEVGVGLHGIATDGKTAWVLAGWDRELVAYDLSDPSAEVELARISLVGNEPLSPEVLAGGRIFNFAGDPRMSRDGYLSCGSCHPSGDQDGQIWDFTDRMEGFRNTQPMWALPPDGPFHWSSNFDELQDFEAAIRGHQQGTGFMADEYYAVTADSLGAVKAGFSPDLDALAAYMQTLVGQVPRSPHRQSDGSWSAEAELGREIFAAQGCDTCHSGSQLTDAGWNEDGSATLHDVGTLLETSGDRLGEPLTGLRTPSLWGLHATAPYLHDGRAATVAEALAGHGVLLSELELSNLVQYLLEIEAEP